MKSNKLTLLKVNYTIKREHQPSTATKYRFSSILAKKEIATSCFERIFLNGRLRNAHESMTGRRVNNPNKCC